MTERTYTRKDLARAWEEGNRARGADIIYTSLSGDPSYTPNPYEQETVMNETINDFETALDTWGIVSDANGEQWIRDGKYGILHRVCGAFWLPPESAHIPTPPFTNAYI